MSLSHICILVSKHKYYSKKGSFGLAFFSTEHEQADYCDDKLPFSFEYEMTVSAIFLCSGNALQVLGMEFTDMLVGFLFLFLIRPAFSWKT